MGPLSLTTASTPLDFRGKRSVPFLETARQARAIPATGPDGLRLSFRRPRCGSGRGDTPSRAPQPPHGGLTVVETGWKRSLAREAVIDARRDKAGRREIDNISRSPLHVKARLVPFDPPAAVDHDDRRSRPVGTSFRKGQIEHARTGAVAIAQIGQEHDIVGDAIGSRDATVHPTRAIKKNRAERTGNRRPRTTPEACDHSRAASLRPPSLKSGPRSRLPR